tara:strand:+ start:181 stop:612 length:432 start_codon:yes stop_codon:yes gene_type:complete
MIKSFVAALSLLILVSCQTTEVAVVEQEQQKEKKYLSGPIITITELCKTLKDQLDIYKTFVVDQKLGVQTYYSYLYSGKCISFPKPILAKKLKKEFEANVNKVSKIEIWKVVLDEDIPEGKDPIFFWISLHIPLEKKPTGTGV